LVNEEQLEVVPHLWVRTPMLAKNIGWVEDAIKMIHCDELGGNCFMNAVKRERIVPFVELSMRWSGAYQ
jgi:hypothetical protein